MIFQESGFSFEFPPSWIVLKYDEHRFYKYLSGDGFKGVDFLCLNPNGELHFLEVKNYLNLFIADGIHPSAEIRSNPIVYVDTYWKKYLDSLHLIKLVHKYYLRKRWYRIFLKLGLNKWAINSKRDWVLWTEFHSIITDVRIKKHFDLWLEIEGDNKKSTSKIHLAILSNLKKRTVSTATIVSIMDSQHPAYLVARPFQS